MVDFHLLKLLTIHWHISSGTSSNVLSIFTSVVKKLMVVVVAIKTHSVANYFSWSPVGAIRAGRNPATYLDHGETVHVDGKLYSFICKDLNMIL